MGKALVADYEGRPLPEEECRGVRFNASGVMALWPEMERQLKFIPHVWDTHWTIDSIREAVVAGHWQAWGFGPINTVRVTVFTYLAHFPAGTVLQIPIAFGNSLDVVLPVMEATFERFAQEMNCNYAEIYGRVGWEKKLKDFKRVAVVLRRKVIRLGVH
jgi:hypothetical protein